MRKPGRPLVLTLVVFSALVGLTMGIAAFVLELEPSDLTALAGFLAISGGTIVGVSIAIGRFGLPPWFHSLRRQLLFISIVATALVLANIGFVARVMFISTHDSALLATVMAFSLGLSIMVTFYVSRPTTENVRQVINTVRQINAGNLQSNIPVLRPDEIGELAKAFNATLKRLQESMSRERTLQRTRRELVEAISHDLRTPIASIRAMIESINDGVVTDRDTVQRYLRTIQSETENLSQLVNDLFELSQIDAGLLKLHLDKVPIKQLVADTVESMSAQATSQRLTIKGEVDPTLPAVSIDPQRVQRVLYNLVQNAIRHTPPDGSIDIRAHDWGNEIEVQVADTGEGIPADDLSRVFERSYRSEKSRSRQSGGAGLGLSIAKGIVEAHGGRIWVNSQPGQGSVFSFTLPKITETKT